MKNSILPLILVFALSSCSVFKSNSTKGDSPDADYRFMFYNVENLFDTVDDPTKNDDEFLPDGDKAWNNSKYEAKLNNIARVTIALGEGSLPDIIGLCEIENQTVLEDLLSKTALNQADYRIVHIESPDERGIDVALFYKNSTVKPLYFEAIKVDLGEGERPTRDILYFKSLIGKKDTIHFFVNHWPSRWGGAEKSAPKRAIAAETLMSFIETIYAKDPSANVVVTGDFNDDPMDASISQVLNAGNVSDDNSTLINLTLQKQIDKEDGTLKYRGGWNYFDQFIVSKALFDGEGVDVRTDSYHIFSGENDFLLEVDDRYQGLQPNRTYHGKKFHGGYSDHLPVYIDLYLKK